jgi:hypothetical protein
MMLLWVVAVYAITDISMVFLAKPRSQISTDV